MFAQAFPADDTAWLALPDAIRATVLARATETESSEWADEAVAAVSYARHIYRRLSRIEWSASAVIVVVASIAILTWRHVIPISVRLSAGWIAAVIVIAGAGLLLAIWLGPGRLRTRAARLLCLSLNLAATQRVDTAAPELRLGPIRPWFTAAAAIIGWLGLIAATGLVATWTGQNATPALPVIVFISMMIIGPAFGRRTASARLDSDGITLPTWRAEIPWSSVSDPAIVRGTALQFTATGAHNISGWLPRIWRSNVTKSLKPGGHFSIRCSAPELALWTAQRYVRPSVSASPDDVVVVRDLGITR